MPEEIEAKIRIASPDGFRRMIVQRGFGPGRTAREMNRLFDSPDGRLRAAGCALRVREEFDDETCDSTEDVGSWHAMTGCSCQRCGQEPRPATACRGPTKSRPVRSLLTFKGPRVPGPIKRRPEHETLVQSAASLVAILDGLGLAESFRYEKRRTTWDVPPCEVMLDELPRLGWFVEVEGPDEAAIRRTLADLGLAGEPLVPQSYIMLLSEHLASLGLDPKRAVFDE